MQGQVVFVVLVVVSGGGQRLPADAPDSGRSSPVAVLRVGGVSFAELMCGAEAEFGVAGRRGDVGLESASGIDGVGRMVAFTTASRSSSARLKVPRKLLFAKCGMGPVRWPS